MKETPIVLFRKSTFNNFSEQEFKHCSKYFPVCQYRSQVPNGSLVIGRYSVLPYYQELEFDLLNNGSYLINSYDQHRWIASFAWYEQLKDYTPQSWWFEDFYQVSEERAPFVVKGATNSRKHDWNTKMFASTKRDAVSIALDLSKDGLICDQRIIIREYIPLKTIETGINGLPFAFEYRFFLYRDFILSGAYYWINCEKAEDLISPPQKMVDFCQGLADIVKDYANFYVLDIAETESGELILIEINDGCMSGLSLNDSEVLYKNLRQQL